MTSSGPQLIRYPGAPRKLPTLLIAWQQRPHSLHTYSTAKLSGSLAEHTQASLKGFPTLGPESSRDPSPPQRAHSSQLVGCLLLDRTSLPELCTSNPLVERGTATTSRQSSPARRQSQFSSTELLLPEDFPLICLLRERYSAKMTAWNVRGTYRHNKVGYGAPQAKCCAHSSSASWATSATWRPSSFS